jgi:two-component system nitrate/nitrite response regulator NarL
MSTCAPIVVTHSCSLFLDGLRQTLARSHFRPVRVLSIDSGEVEKLASAKRECVWLLGVEKFDSDIEEIVRKTKMFDRTVKVVIFSASAAASDVVRALNAGACGFLSQDITSDRLLKSLDLILLGQTVVYPDFWRMAQSNGSGEATNGSTSRPWSDPRHAANWTETVDEDSSRAAARWLSQRELLILQTLMEGASNKAIARKFVITESTVKVHMKAILRKLRLQNRTQAAIWARNHLNGGSVGNGHVEDSLKEVFSEHDEPSPALDASHIPQREMPPPGQHHQRVRPH